MKHRFITNYLLLNTYAKQNSVRLFNEIPSISIDLLFYRKRCTSNYVTYLTYCYINNKIKQEEHIFYFILYFIHADALKT